MKPKLCIYSQPNYLTFRTAIESGALKSTVPILVYLYILCNNKSYKEPSGFLRAEPLSSYFEDRKGYREGNNQQGFEVKKLLSDKSVFPSLTYHLQSAQFITNTKGEQYEHIEYTPYGEFWTYKSKTAMLFLTTYNNFLAKQPAGLIEETAPGIDKLPFRFTGKELDEETGLYYYGARYLDPKYSRWLSGDPALGEYIPQAPIDDEAKKHNENLPGMGGMFNIVNLHVYHYAGNNPIKYTDPDGKITWNRAEDGDIHYNSLYNPDLRNCYAVFSINTEHYRATRETNTIKNHSYSLSGTKDIIEIRQGGIEAQTITTVTLKRFNINLDGKNYDVFKMEGESNIRLLFISNTKHLKSSFFANDPLGDDKSIYNGFYNLNNFIDFLKGEDTNKLAFAAINFGLSFFLKPVEANFTDGLFNHLSSKAEGQVPTTSGIDKDTLDLLSQIIEEYER
ncbi:RHS repeat domain-containing protein [Treponema denticola]|uniref:RHS repeat domain-containing protein n=1 Tax=Treponema denticola TaxID=158 RepID=UPI00208DD856|nr:RHS repeat-associated core domain-containing protein [Treponema denticola]